MSSEAITAGEAEFDTVLAACGLHPAFPRRPDFSSLQERVPESPLRLEVESQSALLDLLREGLG